MNKQKLKLKVILAISVLAMAFSLNTSTTYATTNVTTDITNGNVVNMTVVGEPRFYYSAIPSMVANNGEMVSAIETCIVNKDATLALKYTGIDITDYKTAINNALAEAMNKPGNDYAKFTMKQWSYSYNTAGDISFTFSYIETPAQSQYVDDQVTQIISTIIQGGMSDEQKEKAINDYVLTHVAYDTSLVQHSAYAGVVAPYKTVCQGYALFTYKLLIAAGLDARIIEGSANGTAHAWNLVKIDGNWYHLDTTWNDPIPDVVGRIRYDFFNLQDSQIGDSTRKHVWDKTKYVGYEATTPYVTTDPDILSSGRYNESAAPVVDNIAIVNKVKIADTVTITGLKAGDKVKVYSDSSATAKLLGSGTVPVGSTQITINITQVGSAAGKTYLSVTSSNSTESARIEKDFDGEPVTTAPSADVITTENNAVVADVVKVTGLAVGDIVKVYNSNETTKKVIGTLTVPTGKTEAVLNIPKFPSASGSLYVTVTSKEKLESTLVEKAYVAEVVTSAPIAATDETNQITIANTIKGDSVTVTGLIAGDTIKVYNNNETTKKVIGTIKVALGKTEGTVKISQLGKTEGSVFVSVTTPKKLESTLVEKAFIAEPITDAPLADVITTVNNAVIADTVKLTGLTAGNIVKVYNSNGTTKKVIGTATVAKDKTEVTVNVPKFLEASGNVYVGVTSKDKLESTLVEKAYVAEAKTDAIDAGNIIIVNNTTVDAIILLGVEEGDMIKVYDAATEGKIIGKVTVAKGKKMAVVSIAQLGADSGNTYITVTKKGKLESDRVEKAFSAQ